MLFNFSKKNGNLYFSFLRLLLVCLFVFFGYIVSSLLCMGFLQLRQAGATLHCGGFSCCGAGALGTRASVVVARGLSSCGSWALQLWLTGSVVVAHGLCSCGTQAQLLHGMWDLPGPGIEPVVPALAGRFLTTAPPGKPLSFITIINRGLNVQITVLDMLMKHNKHLTFAMLQGQK